MNKPMDTSLLDRAICFAVKAHAGIERRGHGYPYIVHPMEAVAIVATLTADQELLAAAALHDVVEDTPTTVDDLRSEFGERVAEIVASESNIVVPGVSAKDSWHLRKQVAIDHLAAAALDVKIVAMGDKLSNLRIIYRDYLTDGDALWTRFHAPGGKADLAWYYHGLAESLKELGDTFAYKEYIELINKVF